MPSPPRPVCVRSGPRERVSAPHSQTRPSRTRWCQPWQAPSRRPRAQQRPARAALARAALLAAGQAVWLLTGTTREERIKRAVQVYVDDWENHRQYQLDLKDDPCLKNALAPDEVAIIDDLISELDLRLAAARATNPGRTTQTKMLREAARWVTQGEADGWLRVALGREWRLGSAAAHSRKWALNVRSGANLGTGEDGGVGSVSTTADEFGTSIIAATLMAREGFRLWDESSLATE